MKMTAAKQRMMTMKKTPTITKERLNEFGSKLAQFILTDDWQELLTELTDILQETVDSLSAEDTEIALSEMSHMLEYDADSFVFNFETEVPHGVTQDGRYELTVSIGSKKKPFKITVASRS